MKNNFNTRKIKGYEDDLDRELRAAEMFLNKTNDDVIKNENSYLNNEQSNKKYITDKEIENSLSNESKLFTFADPQLNENTKNFNGLMEDDLLQKYKKQLKSFGFPELGKIIFENDIEKEKTLKFLDFIMSKRSSESEARVKSKKQVIKNGLIF